MGGILNQLDSDDAKLLMYIADELPAQDRAQLERRLGIDAALRVRMDGLRRSMQRMEEVADADMGQLDVNRAVRRASAMMRKVGVSAAGVASEAEELPLRLPRWAYPFAAAAAILITAAVFLANLDPGPMQGQAVAEGQQVVGVQPLFFPSLAWDHTPLPTIEHQMEAEVLAASFDDSRVVLADPTSGWTGAMGELRALQDASFGLWDGGEDYW